MVSFHQMYRRMSFAGRGCVVTGGSKGIGLAVVHRLVELGGTVVTCSRSQHDLDALVRNVDTSGGSSGSLKVVRADVAQSEDREALMDVATEHFSQCGQSMSVLVNNVGTNIRKPTVEYTAKEWDRIISTNLQSAFHLSQLAHPVLKAAATERGLSSAVVNISSVSGGPTCTQTGSVYAATKAAMNHFTKYTACEWAPDGIRVNAIAPWYIRTPLAEGVLAHAEYADAVLSRTPARRVGEPSEVADALAYMASDAASYVSGTVLQVDGGFSSSGFGFYDGFAIPAPKA